MTDKGLLCTGATGSVVAAICCFTPALVLLLGAVGLSAWLAWLDYVLLLPALVLFLGITVYALIRIQRAKAGQTRPTEAR
jgi:mercuric ion transport protein